MDKHRIKPWIAGLLGAAALCLASACGDESGGTYCCTFESRRSACGGGDYTAWETEYYEFSLDDYLEGWDAQRVCGKFDGTDTACGGGCCIYTEDRLLSVSPGACAGPSI